MDLFFLFDEAPRGNCFQIFLKLLRFIELCVALVLLSWSFSRLPIAVRISCEFFAKLFGFIATPLFGFILCNAIIVALVAKPSQFSEKSDEKTEQIYEELAKSGTDRPGSSIGSENVEIVYQDKAIIAETTKKIALNPKENSDSNCDSDLEQFFENRKVNVRTISDEDEKIARDTEAKSDFGSEAFFEHRKLIVRTLSEKLKRECSKIQSEKLRRLETEKCRNLERSGDILYYPDDLSSEEFQRKIEAFIAKEKKFRREESSAIVVHGECC